MKMVFMQFLLFYLNNLSEISTQWSMAY